MLNLSDFLVVILRYTVFFIDLSRKFENLLQYVLLDAMEIENLSM